jgi:hypothetical protein
MLTSADNRASAAVDRRAWKAARRQVLVQCKRCGCVASGVINARGRLVSVNVSADSGRAGWRHAICGGALAAFDIEARR